MAAIVAAVAITAIVAGIASAFLTRRFTRKSIVQAIGGRDGVDPIDEHTRVLDRANAQTATETARADVLQLSLDALTSGVVVTDETGEVLVRNRLADQLATRSHEQTLIDAAVAELLDAAVQGRKDEREVEIFGPPPRTLFINAVPITANSAVAKNVVGALAVIDDVTDFHRIEKTRRDFVANLSHELRTPVGAASLLGEMLVDEPDADVRQQLTDRLLIETDRMTATIDDLLTLSRIESMTEQLDERVVIQTVIEEALARTRVAADSGNIQVGSVVPTEPLAVVGNRDQLVTAVVNLVENAIKYSEPGDSVSVRARLDSEVVSIVVQDTGRGIPARDLDRIFERFYRVDRSRDSATGGTGIGLSIVRHIAINHGGAVEVTSYEGDGSTFTMTLPQEVH
jgi:two-component system sensor histidine kinase SenX3